MHNSHNLPLSQEPIETLCNQRVFSSYRAYKSNCTRIWLKCGMKTLCVFGRKQKCPVTVLSGMVIFATFMLFIISRIFNYVNFGPSNVTVRDVQALHFKN